MSVAAFLEELRNRDIKVWQDGDQLRCNAPAGVLTPDLRDALRQRKSDIVKFLLSANSVAQQQRAIVPLQHGGNRTPIFGVPGHNGDVFCYRALAQKLGADQPFFGLEPPGLDGRTEPLTSVEDLAAYFATQIRAFRRQGPYVIAGYCAGGVIAFELARQLAQQGAAISFVAFFAGAYPDWYGVLPQLRHRAAFQAKRAYKHIAALAALPHRQRRLYVSEKLRQRKAAHDPTPESLLVLRAKIKKITARAVSRYAPQDFDGRVSLFLPSKACLRPDHTMLKWRSVTPISAEYCGPDGCDGDTMLLEPHVGAIAELFRRCRDKSEHLAVSDLR